MSTVQKLVRRAAEQSELYRRGLMDPKGSPSEGRNPPLELPSEEPRDTASIRPERTVPECLQQLHRHGRLFVQEGDGLKRAVPMEVARILNGAAGTAYLVTRLSTQESAERNAYSQEETRDFNAIVMAEESAQIQAHASREQGRTYNYVAFPLLDWSDLDLADPDAPGVPGTPRLPAPAGALHSELHREEGFVDKGGRVLEIGGGWVGAGVSGRNDEGYLVRDSVVHR